MKWLEVEITCAPESEEAVAWLLGQVGCPGSAIHRDDQTGLARVVGWLSPTDENSRKVNWLRDECERLATNGLPAPVAVNSRLVDDETWLSEWRKLQTPRDVGRRLRILPDRDETLASAGRVNVLIEPGMAFGTGSHPTTRMTLEYLERLVRPGYRVADVGTGSGILAIAALKLGASEVWASECDALPRQIAHENAVANDVADRVHILAPDAFDRHCPSCELVLCNIIAETIIALTPTLGHITKPNGHLVCSGIVSDHLFRVAEALRRVDLSLIEIASDGVWRTVLAQRQVP